MDIRWAAMIVLSATGMRGAEKIAVDVYLERGNWPQPLNQAQGIASELFERIDVRVIWHMGALPAVPRAGRMSIGIRLVERAPVSATADAMAAAHPFGSSGWQISVYKDRIREVVSLRPSLAQVFPAYVFAHELAHVMQGTNYHTDSGILSAHWSHADNMAMLSYRMAFTDRDADRIREGLADRLIAAK
jgi:hypothetical protein